STPVTPSSPIVRASSAVTASRLGRRPPPARIARFKAAYRVAVASYASIVYGPKSVGRPNFALNSPITVAAAGGEAAWTIGCVASTPVLLAPAARTQLGASGIP